MSTITLENMEFYAYHGCLEHEKTLGNTFLVTLSIQLNTSKAEKSDNLNDTLNYKEVYDTVSQIMKKRVDLIEHLANNIVTSVINRFAEIEEVSILLSKTNPPVGGKMEKVTISFNRKRKKLQK